MACLDTSSNSIGNIDILLLQVSEWEEVLINIFKEITRGKVMS